MSRGLREIRQVHRPSRRQGQIQFHELRALEPNQGPLPSSNNVLRSHRSLQFVLQEALTRNLHLPVHQQFAQVVRRDLHRLKQLAQGLIKVDRAQKEVADKTTFLIKTNKAVS